ncbi:MAG TPA: hypothetical protein VKP69_00660 [Isosphaeraceae bacterium]|nr:hypothetical protein [Isosphaeraceae bacterium]
MDRIGALLASRRARREALGLSLNDVAERSGLDKRIDLALGEA